MYIVNYMQQQVFDFDLFGLGSNILIFIKDKHNGSKFFDKRVKRIYIEKLVIFHFLIYR